MKRNSTQLAGVDCPQYLEASTTPGFRPADELSDDELSELIGRLADELFSTPSAHAWTVLFGVTVVPRYAAQPCCTTAPGGLVLLSSERLLEFILDDNPPAPVDQARIRRVWCRDHRTIHVYRTQNDYSTPTGRSQGGRPGGLSVTDHSQGRDAR